MRILPTEEHQSRQEKILQAVVHLYIKTGKPVGSSTILENFKLRLSPASIRNVLADLEKEGFLTHPHTSAGRVPTDRGYRFYVDSIVHVQKLAAEEEIKIQTEYSRRMKEIEDLMLSTTRVLSAISHCTGFVLPPAMTMERLRRIELISVNTHQVLAVLVSESGLVQNQMIKVERMPDEVDLRAASQFLNERLVGLSFSEAQQRFLSELHQFQNRQYSQRDFLQSLSHHLFDKANKKDLYMEGASNIFNFPEFQDFESMRSFAHLIDEKEALGEVLNRELNQKGVLVKIGIETSPELKDLSVVSTCYHVRGRPVGVLGILGPKRMEYERMMAIVETVAGIVNQFLDGSHNPILEEVRENE